MTYVLFVPWLKIETESLAAARARANADTYLLQFPGQEYAYKDEEWKRLAQSPDMAHAKQFFEVWYSGQTSVILFGMTDGQIYIHGHGEPGRPNIFSGDPKAHDVHEISAPRLAERLIQSGLQPGFAGKIKCYNCHSAERGAEESSFAQLFADVMWDNGFRSCTFWGYTGSLTSFYENRGARGLHKFSGDKIDLGDGCFVYQDERASARRHPIKPRRG